MKIKLVSIDGKIADPFYNLDQMTIAIEKAKKEKVDLLVFPSNSLKGVSLGELKENHQFQERYKAAKEKFQAYLEEIPFGVVFNNVFTNTYHQQGKTFTIIDSPKILSLNDLAIEEDELRFLSRCNLGEYYIICQGRGTESTSQYVYSNIKMILKDGEVLASNLDTDSNELTYEIPDEISRTPYLDKIKDTNQMFKNILNLQGVGLYQKMKSMNRFKICMGVSGGLDSTVSLLACVEIFKKYNLPLKNIIGVTMPGLGTTDRTYHNAIDLMKKLGITIEDIDLRPLLKMHLQNISQPEGKFDVTFEQTQSRERTQVLLDIANRDSAIMIGTGCMSEFALGWMTYGGDHLSMYAINIGLPKTVVKMYAKWFIKKYGFRQDVADIIKDILDGPVSPELLPIDDKGEQHEKTESLIGDYMVQDFFIYHIIKDNWSIAELFNHAVIAFPEYTSKQILDWLEIFTLRFFTRAYKKNCYGDGLQLFDYSVSPWYQHIPSDIDISIWQREIDQIRFEIEGKGDCGE